MHLFIMWDSIYLNLPDIFKSFHKHRITAEDTPHKSFHHHFTSTWSSQYEHLRCRFFFRLSFNLFCSLLSLQPAGITMLSRRWVPIVSKPETGVESPPGNFVWDFALCCESFLPQSRISKRGRKRLVLISCPLFSPAFLHAVTPPANWTMARDRTQNVIFVFSFTELGRRW